jgi:hypothetical protein
MFTAVSKFFTSAAGSCPTFAFGFVSMWIASKYASHCGIGLPSASTKSFCSTPVMYMRGMPCASIANCRFVSVRAAESAQRDDVGHLRLAHPAARHAAVQVHHDGHGAEVVDVAVDLDPAPVVRPLRPRPSGSAGTG